VILDSLHFSSVLKGNFLVDFDDCLNLVSVFCVFSNEAFLNLNFLLLLYKSWLLNLELLLKFGHLSRSHSKYFQATFETPLALGDVFSLCTKSLFVCDEQL